MRTYILLLTMLGCLTACQSTQQPASNFEPEFSLHDAAFPQFHHYAIETEQQIFSLNDQARAFVYEVTKGIKDPTDKMESLVRGIFDYSKLDLLYVGSANTGASQTFANRAANCLSMSIMTYAMAKEAGFTAKFQDILIPEYWTRREGYSLLNGHINIVISPPDMPGVLRLFGTDYEVDFDPQNIRRHFPKRIIDTPHVMAMFYNNKGADALVKRQFDKAYAYFKAAVLKQPDFDSAWVNLGVLYRIKGLMPLAEQSYKNALALDNDNLTAWENLAFLYQITQNRKRAQQILSMVHHKRDDNPYYHFILGEQAFEKHLYQRALSHYRNALKRDKNKHEIYFGLAKTYYELGDINRSQHYLAVASRKSDNRQDKRRYQGKLDLLTKR